VSDEITWSPEWRPRDPAFRLAVVRRVTDAVFDVVDPGGVGEVVGTAVVALAAGVGTELMLRASCKRAA
jgi:hypothetical protein